MEKAYLTLRDIGEIVIACQEAYDIGYLDGSNRRAPNFNSALSLSGIAHDNNMDINELERKLRLINDTLSQLGYFNKSLHSHFGK